MPIIKPAFFFILALELQLLQIRQATYLSKLETRSVAYAEYLTVFTPADEVQYLHKNLMISAKKPSFELIEVNQSPSACTITQKCTQLEQ